MFCVVVPVASVLPEHLEASGFAYLCTDDTELAIGWLKQHGILRGRNGWIYS